MNIDNYIAYFHDGAVIDICHKGSCLEISMESAELLEGENLDNMPLSEERALKGKLHLEGVGLITDFETPVHGHLKMLHNAAHILDLEIIDSTVTLNLEWVNYPPHPKVDAYSLYKIEVSKIWWENIPDLSILSDNGIESLRYRPFSMCSPRQDEG